MGIDLGTLADDRLGPNSRCGDSIAPEGRKESEGGCLDILLEDRPAVYVILWYAHRTLFGWVGRSKVEGRGVFGSRKGRTADGLYCM